MDASQGPRPVLVIKRKAAAAQARAWDTGGREAMDGTPPADGGAPAERPRFSFGAGRFPSSLSPCISLS